MFSSKCGIWISNFELKIGAGAVVHEETMIAPTDFTDELDLFLYVSGSVQTHFEIAKQAVYSDDRYQLPEDWWSVLRCAQV